MKDNLFRKYFSIYATTLLVSTLVLGLALLYFAAQYFRNDKQSSLLASAFKASDITAENAMSYPGGAVFRGEVEAAYGLIYYTTGNTVFMCGSDGQVLLCSEGELCTHKEHAIPERVLKIIDQRGIYTDVGYLGGFLQESGVYSCGVPLTINGQTAGYVFASASLDTLYFFLSKVSAMFLLSSLIMLIMASVVIYYSTKILTKPLREMSTAAASFAAGDFSARVTATGDDEIGRLSAVFNDMAVSLAEFESVRRSFVANVSHELRTPMTTIGGYIDGMLDGTIPRAQHKRYLTIVSEEVKRLTRLTRSLLDIARMEAGEQGVNMESCNIYDIVINVMINAELRINQKNIDVEGLDSEPKFVMCDRDKLFQVVYNIVDNAIKFTPDGGVISVRTDEDKNKNTTLHIRNSGQGVPEEELKRIFERFYKTDKSRGLDKTGTGLGLYIAKTLMQRMDGELSASSVVGEYTEFSLQLKTGKAIEAPKPISDAPAHKPSLLDIFSSGRKKKPEKKKEDKKPKAKPDKKKK